MQKTLVKAYDELVNTQFFDRPKMSWEWASQLAFWNEYPPAGQGERFFETEQRVGTTMSASVRVLTWTADDKLRRVTIQYEVL